MNNFKIGIVGSGYMAEEHLKTLFDIKSVELVGIYSRNMDNARKLASTYKIKHVSHSIENLYSTNKPHAIIITVPELALMDVVSISSQFPWVHLIEKPPGYNLLEAQKIQSLAEKSENKFFVALNRRHYSSTKILLKNLEDNSVPRIVSIIDQENPAKAARLGQPDLVVKNWMFANSIHLIDYFTLICRGEVSAVKSSQFEIQDNQYILRSEINYSSGDIGFYKVYWNLPGPWSITCISGNSSWELRPIEQITRRTLDSNKAHTYPIDALDLEYKPGLMMQSLELLKSLKGEDCLLPTLDQSLKTMRLIHNIYSKVLNGN